MLFNATKRRPQFIGKPQTAMVELAIKETGYSKDEAIVIGDRLYTDIACGVNAGISSAFVLSGEGTMDDLEKSEIKPEFVFKNIREMLEIMKKIKQRMRGASFSSFVANIGFSYFLSY